MRVLATSGLLLLLAWATQEGQGGVVLEPEPQTTTPKAHGLYPRKQWPLASVVSSLGADEDEYEYVYPTSSEELEQWKQECKKKFKHCPQIFQKKRCEPVPRVLVRGDIDDCDRGE